MSRFVAVALSLLLLMSACASGDSDADTETATGFIFIDSTGSHVCESMLESYPPQCGGPSVKLLDLDPESVVALMSPEDPTLAPVSWTDYGATVTGTETNDGLNNTLVVDPTHEGSSEGLILRVADLGIVKGEPVVWPFDLTNRTDADVGLTFRNGERIEVTLSDDSGEVYRWSDGRFFTQAIEEFELPAGAVFPYVLRGEPIDLPQGEYTARAWVTAPEASNVVITWQVKLTG